MSWFRLSTTVMIAICCLLQPVSVEAQTPQLKPVRFDFTVPIVVKDLHPDIVAVEVICTVLIDGVPVMPQFGSALISVSTLAQTGGIATATFSHTSNVPADAGGKPGAYTCTLFGQEGNVLRMFPNALDARFNTVPGKPFKVEGTFTW
jgi:hypothetical protein